MNHTSSPKGSYMRRHLWDYWFLSTHKSKSDGG